jgi:hypothetical protein
LVFGALNACGIYRRLAVSPDRSAQFLQSEKQGMHSPGWVSSSTIRSGRRKTMISTLPLLEPIFVAEKRDQTGLLSPLSRQIKKDEPGCRCDRWGHPCPNCAKDVAPETQQPPSKPKAEEKE